MTVDTLIEHIQDNVEKGQYLNALRWCTDLNTELLALLNSELKYPKKEAAVESEQDGLG